MRPPRPGALTVRLTQAEGNVTEETNRSPRFLGNPMWSRRLLKTPAGPPSQAGTGGQARPPHARTAGAPTRRPNFGAEWAGSGHTLSTLRPDSRLPGRKTRFRLLARLYRVGSMTHWVPPKGFELFPTSLLLSQAFPGANALRSGPPPGARQVRQSAAVTSASATRVGVSGDARWALRLARMSRRPMGPSASRRSSRR
jgi:hypothetical protein